MKKMLDHWDLKEGTRRTRAGGSTLEEYWKVGATITNMFTEVLSTKSENMDLVPLITKVGFCLGFFVIFVGFSDLDSVD